MRILMVEDDVDLCSAVDIHLKKEGHIVDFAHAGDDGLHFALQNAYDLILLDRMLPGLDGVGVVARLRKEGLTTPVLMITALDGISDRVDGLDAGADDYLAKPFATEELLARIRALSRRPVQWESTRRLTVGDLELDTELCALRGPGSACSLSKREGQLRLARVWGPDAPVEDGNLDNYIHFLRRRLAAAGSAVKIVTARGVGYRLEVPPC